MSRRRGDTGALASGSTRRAPASWRMPPCPEAMDPCSPQNGLVGNWNRARRAGSRRAAAAPAPDG